MVKINFLKYSRSGILAGLLAILWFTAAALSFTRLLDSDLFPHLPVKWLGCFGWILFICSAFYLDRGRLRYALGLFVLFFLLGYVQGPFLEPPSDPLHHLYRTHKFCEKELSELPAKNKGFWQYSMNSVVICTDSPTLKPNEFLKKVDALNGVYWGLASIVLFALSTSAGLPVRWAIFSVFCCFLFFGTNRFSYFSYYSFAASWTSMLIYWMWIAAFFFRRNFKNILFGIVGGFISLPILWVNHLQEAVFISFLILIWLFLNNHQWLWGDRHKGAFHGDKKKERLLRIFKLMYFVALLLVLFVLPQLTFFKGILSEFFIADHWEKNLTLVIAKWGDTHLWGKVLGHRVNDTLGVMGFLPILLTIIVLLIPARYFTEKYPYNGRILLIGLLPFIYLLFPLINYIWASNVYYNAYYRICYSSVYWVTIAYFLYLGEGLFFALLNRLPKWNKLTSQ